jgi:hypothetical protein
MYMFRYLPFRGQVCGLIETVDSVLRAYDKAVYYEDPTPHMSVAWALSNSTDISNQHSARAADEVEASETEEETGDLCRSDNGVSRGSEARNLAHSGSSGDSPMSCSLSDAEMRVDSSARAPELEVPTKYQLHAVAPMLVFRCGNREYEIVLGNTRE